MKKERKERGREVRRVCDYRFYLFLTHIFYVQYLIIPKSLFLRGSISVVVSTYLLQLLLVSLVIVDCELIDGKPRMLSSRGICICSRQEAEAILP